MISVYAHIVNFYLAPPEPATYGYDQEKLQAQRNLWEEKTLLQEKIIALSTNYNSESQGLLKGYAREALSS